MWSVMEGKDMWEALNWKKIIISQKQNDFLSGIPKVKASLKDTKDLVVLDSIIASI